jgi:hypothetical protein
LDKEAVVAAGVMEVLVVDKAELLLVDNQVA